MSEPQPVPDSPRAVRSKTPFEWLVSFVRAGWRPFAGWVSGLVLLVNGVAVPLLQLLLKMPVTPMAWREMALFVGTLLGLAAARMVEKILGAAE